jgi:hypothetical protein
VKDLNASRSCLLLILTEWICFHRKNGIIYRMRE